MLVEMDSGMLSALIKGCDPDYHIMDHPLIKSKGYYCGGHNDRWVWDSHFQGTEEELWETYQLLKQPTSKSDYVLYREKQISEVEEILQDGIARGNIGQQEAARLEIERLKEVLN